MASVLVKDLLNQVRTNPTKLPKMSKEDKESFISYYVKCWEEMEALYEEYGEMDENAKKFKAVFGEPGKRTSVQENKYFRFKMWKNWRETGEWVIEDFPSMEVWDILQQYGMPRLVILSHRAVKDTTPFTGDDLAHFFYLYNFCVYGDDADEYSVTLIERDGMHAMEVVNKIQIPKLPDEN